jgi:hypothetical protein
VAPPCEFFEPLIALSLYFLFSEALVSGGLRWRACSSCVMRLLFWLFALRVAVVTNECN